MGKVDQLRAMRERNFEERKRRVDNVINEVSAVRSKAEPVNRFTAASAAERQAKWRAANRDLHRQRSRESMRKLRSKAEAN